jgi:hypothetical protein
MLRFAALIAFTLVSCTVSSTVPAPRVAEARSVVGDDNIQGRWTIVAVNGRQVSGLWLELGREGLGTVTKTGSGIVIASPQPLTRAHLGCNDWLPNGWTRNGDKLTFGLEMSRRTERGCDPAVMALDDESYEILRKPLTMQLTALNHLRLINGTGTLDLVRD